MTSQTQKAMPQETYLFLIIRKSCLFQELEKQTKCFNHLFSYLLVQIWPLIKMAVFSVLTLMTVRHSFLHHRAAVILAGSAALKYSRSAQSVSGHPNKNSKCISMFAILSTNAPISPIMYMIMRIACSCFAKTVIIRAKIARGLIKTNAQTVVKTTFAALSRTVFRILAPVHVQLAQLTQMDSAFSVVL